jgi:hypothetical protein
MAYSNGQRSGTGSNCLLIFSLGRCGVMTYHKKENRRTEAGQTAVLLLLAMGLFMLGAVAFSVDLSNKWFHRQSAQTAADAACLAGAMDMLLTAQGEATGNAGFTPGTPFTCGAGSTASPCKYASLNGYDSSGNTPGNTVSVSFPGAVGGVTPPDPGVAATPFMTVNVNETMPAWFLGMLSGSNTDTISATASCGVVQATAPVPIIVLNPSCPHAFELSGSTNVKIVGGPNKSIQVNSSNTSCAAATSNSAQQCNSNGPTIDLSKGGPSFNGSDFGVTGAPTTAPSGFSGNSWGPASPISDPYALVNAPTLPGTLSPTNNINPNTTNVLYNQDGCPDHNGCVEYQPGLYNTAIVVKGITAIFAPGVYYMKGVTNDNCGDPGSGCTAGPTGQCHYALDVDANGVVRPSTATGDGSKGVMFYFSNTGAGAYGSVFFGSNAGKPGGRTIDTFSTSNATCPGGTAPPTELNLPATVNGNVLLGQCTGGGTYFGSGSADTLGSIRSILFFQDRANSDKQGQASMQGGGGLVLSGNMYFHNCNAAGTGVNCNLPSAGYNSFFQLQGSSGGDAYVLGNITTDQLVLGGGGNISMLLNPNAVYKTLRVALLR